MRSTKAGIFSTYASDAVDIISRNYDGSNAYRKWAILTMYTMAYHIQNSNHVDYRDLTLQKLKTIPPVDEDLLKECFRSNFIPINEIEWDVNVDDDPQVEPNAVQTIPTDILQAAMSKPAPITNTGQKKVISSTAHNNINNVETQIGLTSKEDLYLAPPKYPRFDTSVIRFAQKAAYDRTSIIYESLPKIPRKQNEISVTTNVDEMIEPDLMKLFPNHIIQTRKPPMYSELPKVKFYEDIGTVIPIKGFTEKQLLDNVIKYPHLYQLKREVDGQLFPFHHHIEIDGELHITSEIWDTLPIAQVIPKTAEFMLEYVTRRYLLERDVRKIEHKYPMLGTLEPFLTLFGPKEFYLNHGFRNLEDVARQCVTSRVSYRQSRNGVLANSGVSRCIYAPFCIQHDCKVVCPTYNQIDYLLDQNGISPPDSVFSAPEEVYQVADKILSDCQGKFRVVETDKKDLGKYINAHQNEFTKVLTYCSICNNWKGSKYSMVVYNLKFSKYVERIRASWTMSGEPDDLQYMRIWANSAKVLIISNVDYVSFGDVECQSLLQLVQDREEQGKTTIVICKKLENLVGRSSFFKVFSEVLKGGTDRK